MDDAKRAKLRDRLARFPRTRFGHLPTPVEEMLNLGRELGCSLAIKRDDCTGFGFGGNKVRQLQYYLGEAGQQGADTILITGAVQSNFVRTAAAMAARMGMQCHIQLEERVAGQEVQYHENGNVLLNRLLGATLHHYPDGEDEAGADAALMALADRLKSKGRNPYVVPLAPSHPPLGALGYVQAAIEVAAQLKQLSPVAEIFIASGSALTHCGLLFGLRYLGLGIRVTGVCVRRDADQQSKRVTQRVADLARLLDLPQVVDQADIILDDTALARGYGQIDANTRAAILKAARTEGVFLDPVYTGKVMATLMARAKQGLIRGNTTLFWHTGGQPALFAYGDQLTDPQK